MYIVKLNQTYSDTTFTFRNFDDAMGFIGMAIESGKYESAKGETEPVKATIEFKPPFVADGILYEEVE